MIFWIRGFGSARGTCGQKCNKRSGRQVVCEEKGAANNMGRGGRRPCEGSATHHDHRNDIDPVNGLHI